MSKSFVYACLKARANSIYIMCATFYLNISCSLRSKERIYFLSVELLLLIELLAMLNRYYCLNYAIKCCITCWIETPKRNNAYAIKKKQFWRMFRLGPGLFYSLHDCCLFVPHFLCHCLLNGQHPGQSESSFWFQTSS